MAWQGSGPGLTVASKVLLSVAALSLTTTGLGWRALTQGLAAFGLPDLLILVLDLAARYILLVGTLAHDLLSALALRSVGRNPRKTTTLGAIGGTAFLRSLEAATQLHEAMECRGFAGEYRSGRRPRPLTATDLGILALDMGLVVAFALLQGVPK